MKHIAQLIFTALLFSFFTSCSSNSVDGTWLSNQYGLKLVIGSVKDGFVGAISGGSSSAVLKGKQDRTLIQGMYIDRNGREANFDGKIEDGKILMTLSGASLIFERSSADKVDPAGLADVSEHIDNRASEQQELFEYAKLFIESLRKFRSAELAEFQKLKARGYERATMFDPQSKYILVGTLDYQKMCFRQEPYKVSIEYRANLWTDPYRRDSRETQVILPGVSDNLRQATCETQEENGRFTIKMSKPSRYFKVNYSYEVSSHDVSDSINQ